MFLALLLGTGVFLGSLLFYAMATALIVHLVARLIQKGSPAGIPGSAASG